MNKLLSLIIPTYNKEEYLEKCIHSVIGTGRDNLLELIIVNDGSTDRTQEIAHALQAQFPGIVVVIDKQNGNYGSAVNAALPVARGKYVKLLDADDQVNREGLSQMLELLEDNDCDMLVTNYLIEENGKSTSQIYPWTGIYNKVYPFLEILPMIEKEQYPILMHNVTYRTEVLQKNSYHQTEGISYTDMEWIFYPLFYIKTVMFANIIVYKYFLGVPGQTMAPQNYINGVSQLMSLVIKMQKYYEAIRTHRSVSKDFHYYITWHLFRDWYRRIFKMSLLFADKEHYNFPLLQETYQSLKELDMDLCRYVIGRNKACHVYYMKYWIATHKRLPLFIRKYLMKHTDLL